MSEKATKLREIRDLLGSDHPETMAAFDERMAEVLFEEASNPQIGLWMLSFVDPALAPPPEQQRPGGPSFLGGLVVLAAGPMAALTLASALRLNPGGEVLTVGPLPLGCIGPEWQNRLLTADEMRAIPEPDGWR